MQTYVPKISIIIPVYNAEKYLSKCLDSVLNQSFADFEVICVEDCSTDNSPDILRRYAQSDSKIKIIQNESNLKASGSRNVGLDNAAGEYVYFIDDDDYIDADYLQQLYDKAVESNAEITANTNITIEANGNSKAYIHPSMPKVSEQGSFIDNTEAIEKALCVVWMRLFKREFIEKYNIRFQKSDLEDNVFHFMTHFYASSVYVFQGLSSYHYVIHNDSIIGTVKSNNRRDYAAMKSNDIIFDFLRDNDLLEKNKAKLFHSSAFINVDTEEKFSLYKSYFKKVRPYMEKNNSRYNDMDFFFADIILSSDDLNDYLSHYHSNVAIAFLKNRSKNQVKTN